MSETRKLVAILVADVVGYSRARDIFLSYSAKDDAIVRLALGKLEAPGTAAGLLRTTSLLVNSMPG